MNDTTIFTFPRTGSKLLYRYIKRMGHPNTECMSEALNNDRDICEHDKGIRIRYGVSTQSIAEKISLLEKYRNKVPYILKTQYTHIKDCPMALEWIKTFDRVIGIKRDPLAVVLSHGIAVHYDCWCYEESPINWTQLITDNPITLDADYVQLVCGWYDDYLGIMNEMPNSELYQYENLYDVIPENHRYERRQTESGTSLQDITVKMKAVANSDEVQEIVKKFVQNY